jgi:hypothetical protein
MTTRNVYKYCFRPALGYSIEYRIFIATDAASALKYGRREAEEYVEKHTRFSSNGAVFESLEEIYHSLPFYDDPYEYTPEEEARS